MAITLLLATLLSGALVGFSLGLIGGGGSILAVPLLLYVVGIQDPHVAIGTAALAVATNAFVNLLQHARAGTVKWPCAGVFAAAGVVGATIGSTIGKRVDGQALLFMFALVMIAVAIAMLRGAAREGIVDVRLTPRIAVRLAVLGLLTGIVSGFFGIGGGFLVVPGIMAGSGMAALNAIGSSLVSVSAFGMTTATNYALSGLIDWKVAGLFLTGGALGGYGGMRAAIHLSTRKGALSRIFAGVLVLVAAYMMWRSGSALGLI